MVAWRSRSPRSIIWPTYARPIGIWRGVIPAVRSCSYPDGLLPDDQRAGQRSAATPPLPRPGPEDRIAMRCAQIVIEENPLWVACIRGLSVNAVVRLRECALHGLGSTMTGLCCASY